MEENQELITYLRYTPQAAALKVLGGAISARKT